MDRLNTSAGKALWRKWRRPPSPRPDCQVCRSAACKRYSPKPKSTAACAPTPHPPKYAKNATNAKARLAKPTSYWNSGLPDSQPRRLASPSWNTKCLTNAKSPTRPTAVGVTTPKAEAASGKREIPTPTPKMPAISSRMCSTHAIISLGPLLEHPSTGAPIRRMLASKLQGRHRLALYSPECVEGEFCELRGDGVLGVLRSWLRGSAGGIMLVVEGRYP